MLKCVQGKFSLLLIFIFESSIVSLILTVQLVALDFKLSQNYVTLGLEFLDASLSVLVYRPMCSRGGG